ncbi:MAG: hypothetical protein A2857_03270 [Candidatus Levybacteria bacterium RIFCSPHIGHO2_01_FULL_36_15]|nr:MAG: hypothetical protein A2857_03270 [Candidatus Levybacteria bacterium RIFCSPHIGHO2_01_FULL_36_15]
MTSGDVKDLQPEAYFNLNDCYFSDIFKDINFVWEALSKTKDYITNVFHEGIIKPDYKNNFVFIGKGTIIQEGVQIQGPAVIGKNCFLGHSSFIRENCILGEGVHIGHAVEIKNSIFLNKAVAAHLNYIGDSIIGNNVNISGGAILANFRLDKKSVSIKKGGKKIETCLDKFSSIVGDDVIIGVNSVLNPGTLIGKNSLVYPLTSVSGFYAAYSIIK